MGLMGRLLGLDVLVEGSVQQLGEQLRITGRLVDVHTGRLIWSATADYPSGDSAQVEERAAHDIAVQIAAHIAIHNTTWPAADPHKK